MNETAALYLRLSKEDIDKLNEGDESASIQNQESICQGDISHCNTAL